MQVMKVVLGETCTRFPAGKDGGRDGWFRGEPTDKLKTQDKLEGTFVVQCKHTSSSHHTLSVAGLSDEVAKIRNLAKGGAVNYILMTNRHVTALAEAAIRKQFEAIAGVTKCVVLAESWIEDVIDTNPRLLRLVPRLYGVGDLNQILSYAIEKQTLAVLEEYAQTLRTFVPTDSYRRAEATLHGRRFVVLVGPPASGKTAIASNLCMVSGAQDPAVRVMRIETADQFKETWSPEDKDTIFWVDDVFGETTLDELRLHEWSAALEKVEAARKRGAKVIFCTRDYILAAAKEKLKSSKCDILDDARVRVNVTELSLTEREAILYNHIKHGDIPNERKRAIKPFLPTLASLKSFSPELARRLGSKRFSNELPATKDALKAFFDNPINHFRDVLHGLADGETTALTVCLFNSNKVPDPVSTSSVPNSILTERGLTLHQIRKSFEQLEGSLLKKVRVGNEQVWQVHHPSMIEALHAELGAKSSELSLYVESAQVRVLLRDSTCVPSESKNSRLIFLPSTVYPLLASRLSMGASVGWEKVGEYLIERSSDELLMLLTKEQPIVLENVLRHPPDPGEPDVAARLAVRLSRVLPTSLLRTEWLARVVESIDKSMGDHGWLGCLDVDGFEPLASVQMKAILERDTQNRFPSFDKLFDWHADNLGMPSECGHTIEVIKAHANRLREWSAYYGVLQDGDSQQIESQQTHYVNRLQERLTELEEHEEAKADYYADEWKERWQEERFEIENGMFRDVDE
jgi:hypothetical protein